MSISFVISDDEDIRSIPERETKIFLHILIVTVKPCRHARVHIGSTVARRIEMANVVRIL